MLKKFLFIILIILIITSIGYFILKNVSFVNNEMLEVLPSANTIPEPIKTDIIDNIDIYLINNSIKDLEKESRIISLKELSNNPYLTLLNELKIKSQNTKLISPIPENAKIISANLENSTLIIDLSDEFIMQDVSNELDLLILKSISKTITNFKEIKNIKINIEGNDKTKLGTFDLSSTFSNNSF